MIHIVASDRYSESIIFDGYATCEADIITIIQKYRDRVYKDTAFDFHIDFLRGYVDFKTIDKWEDVENERYYLTSLNPITSEGE